MPIKDPIPGKGVEGFNRFQILEIMLFYAHDYVRFLKRGGVTREYKPPQRLKDLEGYIIQQIEEPHQDEALELIAALEERMYEFVGLQTKFLEKEYYEAIRQDVEKLVGLLRDHRLPL